jgi:hypothetical protein
MFEKVMNELHEKAVEMMETDPAKSANQLRESLHLLNVILKMSPMTNDERGKALNGLVEDHLRVFKIKVQNELLASQQATNNALADALNMSREKREEKKHD